MVVLGMLFFYLEEGGRGGRGGQKSGCIRQVVIVSWDDFTFYFTLMMILTSQHQDLLYDPSISVLFISIK